MGRFSRLELERAPAGAPESLEDAWPDMDDQGCMAAGDDQFHRGLYEAALRYYSRALTFNRDLHAAWAAQVRCLICTGEFREAVIWSDRALERFWESPELFAGKGLALVLRGDPAEGMEYLDGAVELQSPSPWVWLARGEALLVMKQPVANAARCFLKAGEDDPEDWRVSMRTGMAYNNAGMAERARGPLLHASRRAPENPLLLLHLGRMHAGLGEHDAAAGCFRRAIVLRPSYLAAEQALDRLERSRPFQRLWSRLRGRG